MKRVPLCLLLALLAGCAANPYPAGSPQAFCWKQANNDPEVTRLKNIAATEGGLGPYTENKIKLAFHQAMQRCLIARGAAPKGGVEPVVPD